MKFYDKLNGAITQNQSLLSVGLDPNPEMLPERYSQKSDPKNMIDSLWNWLEFTISQTSDLVCAYKPTLGFYAALGIPGWELLEKNFKSYSCPYSDYIRCQT